MKSIYFESKLINAGDENELENPFSVKEYKGREYFCDRELEVEKLNLNIRNGIDTTLISPRRMGKTGLIYRFFESLEQINAIEPIYVDIYAARSLSDFVKLLAEAILIKFPEQTTIGHQFIEFIKGFKPLIGYDALTGEPQIQISYQTAQEKEYSLQSLFRFLDMQDSKIVLAIDEFQQIREFPEKNIEALLRTYTQQLKNVRFIYCGSKKALMLDIFSNTKRPFYGSTQFLLLDKINLLQYSEFIKLMFNKHGIEIQEDAVDFILTWTKRHTFFTQSVCNMVFLKATKLVTINEVKHACYELLKVNEPIYFQYRQLLTTGQWNFLIAIAKEDEVTQLTAQNFLAKYEIGTPANSRRISRSLIEKELILETLGKKVNSYQVYDVFLSRWLASEY
jgi:AAA+ ATPase superfamily predicted ATPase